MTFEEFSHRMDDFSDRMMSEFPAVMQAHAGMDLPALIVKRVTEQGTNDKGEKFSAYSTDPMYINTSNNSPKKLQAKGKHGETVFAKTGQAHKTTYFNEGYRGFRDRIGRSTDKNFELTGEMWRGFGMTDIREEGNNVTVTLAGKNEMAQKKIDGNSKREGQSIIEPTLEEIEKIEGYIQDWIDKLTNEFFES